MIAREFFLFLENRGILELFRMLPIRLKKMKIIFSKSERI